MRASMLHTFHKAGREQTPPNKQARCSDASCISEVLLYTMTAAIDLWRRGVTHRDLKLENLMLARPGDIRTIKIVDFG